MAEFIISNEQVSYPAALGFMKNRVDGIISGEKLGCVWLLEHPPLYTAGTSAKNTDMLQNQFPVYEAGRGGQYTYHGPGQIVGYVMLRLEPKDVKLFVWRLEEWIIQTLLYFGIVGERREGRVGIWTGEPEEKIAAIGIRLKKWVSFHGVSININPDLSHFGGIVPCGIKEFGVTSFEKLGKKVRIEEVQKIMLQKFGEVFE